MKTYKTLLNEISKALALRYYEKAKYGGRGENSPKHLKKSADELLAAAKRHREKGKSHEYIARSAQRDGEIDARRAKTREAGIEKAKKKLTS